MFIVPYVVNYQYLRQNTSPNQQAAKISVGIAKIAQRIKITD